MLPPYLKLRTPQSQKQKTTHSNHTEHVEPRQAMGPFPAKQKMNTEQGKKLTHGKNKYK